MFHLILAFAIALQAGAQNQRRDTRAWYQAYSDAQRAIQQQRWQEAIDSLEHAKRLGPKPGRRVPSYGDRFEDFLPDYYLGVAYLNLSRFAEADRAFDAVGKSDLIRTNDREFKAFETQRRTARFETLLIDAQRSLDEKRFDEALRAANAAAATGVDAAKAQTLVASIRTAQQAAAAPPATTIANAPATTTPAAPTPERPAPAQTTAQTVAQSAPPTVSQTAAGAPVNAPIVGTRQPTPARPVAAPPKAPAAVANQGVVISPAQRRRDEELAISTFLSGQYGEASRLLTGLSGLPAPSSRVYFYLACAEVARVLTGEQGGPSIDSAKAVLARAGDVNQFATDRRFISPRILRILGVVQ